MLYSSHWNYLECKEVFDFTLDDFLFFGGILALLLLLQMKSAELGILVLQL